MFVGEFLCLGVYGAKLLKQRYSKKENDELEAKNLLASPGT